MSRNPFLPSPGTPNNIYALSVRKLNKSYISANDRIQVLMDFDLELPSERIIAITGASGTGKSTLLHLIGGMDYPDSGIVLYNGANIFNFNKAELAKFRNETIGFVFQFHHLLPEFTALENVMFPFLIRGVPKKEVEEETEDVLIEVGLKDRLHNRAAELSGGERQRVALARAIVTNPKVLLADEPTGSLDPRTAEFVFILLLKLHITRKLTSIVVTHNERLARVCDQVMCLQDGKLIQNQ